MARGKGMGNLKQERNGCWTMRVGVGGKRFSRCTGTRDRVKAEQMLQRFLAPLGLGSLRLPLAEVWQHYEMSPNRPDLAQSTLKGKRNVWMQFAAWVEKNHMEITDLAQVTNIAVEEYLAQYRCHHSANTYNNHVCVLREVFHVLAKRAGLPDDPWANVRLLADDSRSRRELTLDELGRLFTAAANAGPEWKLLVMTGTYTGQRLGDCCRLSWNSVNIERGIIQLIPQKTRKHSHGRPVTIPLHPELRDAMETIPASERHGYVNKIVADYYRNSHWRIDHELGKIFKSANITMSVRVEGRRHKAVEASFHSLRHTFVSLATNAGVPIPIVQSIVGHSSTAMTMHYYHENEDKLRMAVEAIPSVGTGSADGKKAKALVAEVVPSKSAPHLPRHRAASIPQRLKSLDALFGKGLISRDELHEHRARILAEV